MKFESAVFTEENSQACVLHSECPIQNIEIATICLATMAPDDCPLFTVPHFLKIRLGDKRPEE